MTKQQASCDVSKMVCAIFVLCIMTAIASPAKTTFKTLAAFEGSNGAGPRAPLIQATDGNFYGVTAGGGTNNYGTAFKMTPGGTVTVLYNFCSQTNCADGAGPNASLALGVDGNFYGTTGNGGANGLGCLPRPGCGTVFRLTAAGELTTLYSFCSQSCADGAVPIGLVRDLKGNFYGLTEWGGANSCLVANQDWGCGTIFRIGTTGELATLYNFDGTHGESPVGLTLSVDGMLYGTTAGGGVSSSCIISIGCGTVFKVTAVGQLTSLYSFCAQASCADGADPQAGVVQAADGNFYGTTLMGGVENSTCGGLGCGTVFKITSAGKLTTLHNFNARDGYWPGAALVQATDGNLYGTASQGASNACQYGCGTVFSMTLAGELTTLHSFAKTDGSGPGGLLQATNRTFYGTTSKGGDLSCGSGYGCGTAYSLSVGLGPFVDFARAAGRVGQTVGIFGQGFTGASGVSFSGVPATFTVRRGTFLTATVPAGATTGCVTVTTPTGLLTSNVPFPSTNCSGKTPSESERHRRAVFMRVSRMYAALYMYPSDTR